MISFRGHSANDLWLQVAGALADGRGHHEHEGRDGPTREFLHVAMELDNPLDRWVISRNPPINPAFALADVLWILNGSDDSAFLNYWNSRLPRFAGTGSYYHGAYGKRLRRHFGVDQLISTARAMGTNPRSRQYVLQIWDPASDLANEDGSPKSPDIPCNVCSILKVRDGRLDWLQIMRSNDVHLGLPQNLLQFTILQELMAGWVGASVGTYHHVSDSLHLYRRDAGATPSAGLVTDPNTDDLMIPLSTFDEAIDAMYEFCLRLIDEQLSETHLSRLVRSQGGAKLENWARVLGAEAARKRGWQELAWQLSETCTNPALRQAWGRWLDRVGGSLSAAPKPLT